MAHNPEHPAKTLQVVAYDPRWPHLYSAEKDRLLAAVGEWWLAIEHIGSTAVPGLVAKPILDIMAAVQHLSTAKSFLPHLNPLGYRLVETGMRNRLFLQCHQPPTPAVNLHIVEHATWPTRKERLMRDYLCSHPEAALAYAKLKQQLALQFAHDPSGYTQAKTAIIQEVVNRARAKRGLPPIDVWSDE